MTIDPRKIESMNILAEGIRSLFPDKVEFHRAPDAHRNFFFDWPLEGQPEDLTQQSRTFSIHFSDQFLEQFSSLNKADRTKHIDALRKIVADHLENFDDGRSAQRYRVKDAYVVDVTHDLAI
ncbi:MAG: hypothetical protein J0I36_08560 [Pandoraea sp.]|nr:hypothetical protein [Pandoraea sp.]